MNMILVMNRWLVKQTPSLPCVCKSCSFCILSVHDVLVMFSLHSNECACMLVGEKFPFMLINFSL